MLKTESDIIRVIQDDHKMMDILKTVQHLNLPDWWICAGFIRSKIWDTIHEFKEATALPDVDVIYFDSENKSQVFEKGLEGTLNAAHPGVPWSVKNQARMHLLNNVTPYKSSVDAISKFPETATALGVKLSIKGKLIVTTPCGIDDVLQCKVKPTAYFMATKERMNIYNNRMLRKNWPLIWPNVKVQYMTNSS